MKDVKDMTQIELLNWLRKTKISFDNAYERAGYEAYRKDGSIKWNISDLIYRYEELRIESKERNGGKIWNFFCNENSYSTKHDAFDNLA